MSQELTFTADETTIDSIVTWGFTVAYAEYDHEQSRHAFDWTVTRDDVVLGTSNVDWSGKLRTGVCGPYDNPAPLSEMLRTLFSFLGAWVDAFEYADRTGNDSENGDLFPTSMVPMTEAFSSDELALFGEDIYGER